VTGPQRTPVSHTPAIVGILLAGAVILVVGLWLGRNGIGGDPGRAVPPLTLVSPAPGDVIAPDARIVFESPRLVKAPEGWRSGRLHLHAVLDGVELMPGAADIEPLRQHGRFAWRLPPLGAGAHEILLRWSGPDHRPLEEGATPVVRFEVRPAASAVKAPLP